MFFRILPVWLFVAFLVTIPALSTTRADAKVASLQLIDAYATLPGETGKVGFFSKDQRIDLLFNFDVETDSDETARLTWDVYNRYDRVAFSGERELPCANGPNALRIEGAIPSDLGTGLQSYRIYASVSVGSLKKDVEFRIRVESPRAFPNVMIEDVRLTPREDTSPIAEDVGDAAIPYMLEIDFRIESIISWARAEIRWHGLTADGFVLDQGIGTTDVDEGFNTFSAESYLARPPYGSTPEADFSVEVFVFGYFDTVTFPIDSLPVSLVEIRSARGVETEYAFSVGEAFLVTGDGIRASFFGKDETIIARLLTGGIVPENANLLMRLKGGPNDTVEDFSTGLQSGIETPIVDFELPSEMQREPGFYDFTWAVMVGNVLFSERSAHLTISGREGIEVPTVIDLPGEASFTAPIQWNVSIESEPGLYATMVTPDGMVCRLLGNSLDEPLRVELLADVFESNLGLSGLPVDAAQLTTESDRLENEWESVRRSYLGGGKVFVHDYWLYRIGDGEYQFLVATSVGNEDQVTDAYAASDAIKAGLDFSI